MKHIIISNRLSTTESNKIITKSISELKIKTKKKPNLIMNMVYKLSNGISYKQIAKGYMLL